MIDWHSVDTVLLDMDGTLLDLQFDNWFWQQHVPECYARQLGLEQAEANRIIHDWITSHQGTLNWYCLDFWTAELGLEIAGLKRAAGDRISVRPGAEAFLQQLKASDKQVIMVTNAHRDALHLKIERTGIDQYFDELVSSHDYGHPRKPRRSGSTCNGTCPLIGPRPAGGRLPAGTAQRPAIRHWPAGEYPAPGFQPAQTIDTDPFPAIDDLAVLP